MSNQVAIVMSEVFLRRLSPSLMPFVRRRQDFFILSIHRPIDALIERIEALRPQGLITEWLPEVTDRLIELGLPTVVADTDFVYPHAVSLDVDDWAVGAEAAHSFQQAGYASVACLGNRTPYSEQRIEGFQKAYGRRVPVFTEDSFKDARYSEQFVEPGEALLKWLQALPKPVGVFAVHDPLGRFLCSACQKLDLAVPDAVSVIGANNDDLVCGLSHPMLSSVAIPWERLGALVGDWMQRLMAGDVPPAEPLRVQPGAVVMRHSANHLLVDDPALRRAMTYLSDHLDEPINVATLCTDLRVARRSLERKFREFYRCTPREMLCRMRVNLAKKLLIESSHSIARIAELSGFNDPERLAVIFKKETGQTPTQWRKAGTARAMY
jgi:LacI family transcriptional regulator